ncbi:DddA-like double-stranded DNA deaminase toxin [Krasilnikovia sp. M28-CT-15]|uniref:DddA-like double-stranded DNA deaminase toxin n=1 Tax=Krasilnikovia sp. M28-CT-15 TaxID=3373540 RepID=UPI0038769642
MRDAAARLRLPPSAYVAGIALDQDGHELHPEPIVNGAGGQIVDNAATLVRKKAPWSRTGNVGLSHVEGHVAALMRERLELRRVRLVLTRKPCEGDLGCDELLPDMLPEGSMLEVYVREGGQLRFHDRYVGNGKVVRRRDDN